MSTRNERRNTHRHSSTTRRWLTYFLGVWLSLWGWTGCGDDKDKALDGQAAKESAFQAQNPEQVLDLLHQVFNERDTERYADLLDEGFIYREQVWCDSGQTFPPGLQDVLTFDRDQELDVLVGAPAPPERQGMLRWFRHFEFEFNPLEHTQEAADVDGPAEEVWEAFKGHFFMVLLDEKQDGFGAAQLITLRMRPTETGSWKLVRWIGHPRNRAEVDCGRGYAKRLLEYNTWGQIKHWFVNRIRP